LPAEKCRKLVLFKNSIRERQGINSLLGLFGTSHAKSHVLEMDIAKPEPFCFLEKKPIVFFC